MKSSAQNLCPRCGSATLHYGWQMLRDGRRALRVDCLECGRFVRYARQTGPAVAEADQRASAAPLLDVLLALDADGCVPVRHRGFVGVLHAGRLRPASRIALALQTGPLQRHLKNSRPKRFAVKKEG